MVVPSPRATLLRGGRLFDPSTGVDSLADLLIDAHGTTIAPQQVPSSARIVDVRGLWVMPGLVDLQVHLREPGAEHKEDLLSGSRAAFAGGVTTVVVMPNTQPSLDTVERVMFQAAHTAQHGGARVLVAAAATVALGGTVVTDVSALRRAGAVALTDDGLPVLDDAVMFEALQQCVANDLLFMQHAEDTRMSQHGCMTEGPTSRAAGVHAQPADAEGVLVERDLRFVAELGARYHVLHCSTARSLRAVRAAKAAGLAVTCEASPHHLLLTDADVATVHPPRSANDLNVNRKMNPPLRDSSDRDALVAALLDGTVDAVATDHAPHHADEKARGIVAAPFGVTGLETAIAALLSFVHSGQLTPMRAVQLMTTGPARVLRRTDIGRFGAGALDVCVVDPTLVWDVAAGALLSRSKNSAFLGTRFTGRVMQTWHDARCVYQRL
jgi:dihydroorotase